MSEAPWFNRTRRCAADWPAPLRNAAPPTSPPPTVGRAGPHRVAPPARPPSSLYRRPFLSQSPAGLSVVHCNLVVHHHHHHHHYHHHHHHHHRHHHRHHHHHHYPPHSITTTIANYGTQAQVPAHGRNGPRWRSPWYTCAHVCARVCARAPRRLYVTSSHGNQCSWPPTRSHGAKPTRPASLGHLCASARILPAYLSLFLDLSPVAPLRARSFLLLRARPLPLSFFSFFIPSPPPSPLPRTLFFLFFVRILLSSVPLYLLASLREDYLAPAKDISIASVVDTESIIKWYVKQRKVYAKSRQSVIESKITD